jgi:hypothetical protein
MALLGLRGFPKPRFRRTISIVVEVAWVLTMSCGYNVFSPEDLDLAQSILDEVWISLPIEAREGPRSKVLREQLARRVLAAMTKECSDREELKATLMPPEDMAKWAWRCDDTPISELSNSSGRLSDRRM